MTFGKRLLAYAATIIVVPWVALTIWEQFPDNRCGGGDCNILVVEALFGVLVPAFVASVVVCLVVEARVRHVERRRGVR